MSTSGIQAMPRALPTVVIQTAKKTLILTTEEMLRHLPRMSEQLIISGHTYAVKEIAHVITEDMSSHQIRITVE